MKYYLTVNDRGQCFDPMNNIVAHIVDPDLDKIQLLRYIFECKEPMGIDYIEDEDHILIKFNSIELYLQLISQIDLLKICNDIIKCSIYYEGLKSYIKYCIIEMNNRVFMP